MIFLQKAFYDQPKIFTGYETIMVSLKRRGIILKIKSPAIFFSQ